MSQTGVDFMRERDGCNFAGGTGAASLYIGLFRAAGGRVRAVPTGLFTLSASHPGLTSGAILCRRFAAFDSPKRNSR